jgi:hypothetical protein
MHGLHKRKDLEVPVSTAETLQNLEVEYSHQALAIPWAKYKQNT